MDFLNINKEKLLNILGSLALLKLGVDAIGGGLGTGLGGFVLSLAFGGEETYSMAGVMAGTAMVLAGGTMVVAGADGLSTSEV